MYLLLYFIAIIIVYVASFKDSFTKENLEKVTPLFAVIALIILVITVLECIAQ